MVNINIQIPDELHKKAKIKCAIDETTLKDFIINSIKDKYTVFEINLPKLEKEDSLFDDDDFLFDDEESTEF